MINNNNKKVSLACANFLTLFLSTSPLGHLVCLMFISSDAEGKKTQILLKLISEMCMP